MFRSSPDTDGFYTFYISQGSVATQLRCGGMFSNHFTTIFSQNAVVKKFRKSVNIWQRYGQKFVAYFFLGHPVGYCVITALTIHSSTQWYVTQGSTWRMSIKRCWLWRSDNVNCYRASYAEGNIGIVTLSDRPSVTVELFPRSATEATAHRKWYRFQLCPKAVAYLGEGACAWPPFQSAIIFYDGIFGCFTNFFHLKHQNLGIQ